MSLISGGVYLDDAMHQAGVSPLRQSELLKSLLADTSMSPNGSSFVVERSV